MEEYDRLKFSVSLSECSYCSGTEQHVALECPWCVLTLSVIACSPSIAAMISIQSSDDKVICMTLNTTTSNL